MILMGDEVRRTQQGNNNACCQDNEFTWFGWFRLENHAEIHRFVKALLEMHRRWCEGDRDDQPLTELLRPEQVQFHGVDLGQPDENYTSPTLAMSYHSPDGREQAYIMINAYWEPLGFKLPPPPSSQHWQRWIDTSRPAPDEIYAWTEAPVVQANVYPLGSRSVVVIGCRREQ